MANSTGVNYEQVSSVVLDMLSSGVKPTVRGVIKITGGKTETVSGLLRDFHDKRDAEVSKMADELGSGSIAALLANEIQLVVDRKTNALTDIVERQKQQIAEIIELLDEKESDCKHRVELAEAQSKQTSDDAIEKIKIATERSGKSEASKVVAEQALIKVESDTQIQIEKTNTNAETEVKAAEQKAITLIDSAKSEANALVKAANKQVDKAESETITLRQQVKELSVDQAKHEIEQTQFVQAKNSINQLQIAVAESKTLVVQLQTEKIAFIKDAKRLESDLVETKGKADKLSQAQTHLVELQKQLSQAQTDLSQSNREIDTLSRALSKG